MKFTFEIEEEEMQGYLKSIIRDKMKASVAQRISSMMGSYWSDAEIRDTLSKAIRKRSDDLIPQLLADKANMDEIAQEAVTKHMMAKIKRNIKKMEQS